MAEKKKTKKKTNKKVQSKKRDTKKEKVEETFEVTKNKNEKIVKSKGTEKIPKKKKGQLDKQDKILKNFIIGFLAILVIIGGIYFYTQTQINVSYKGIDYEAKKIGADEGIIFYETQTLLKTNDGTNQLFGFRLRTSPRELKKIPFENVEEFTLKKINGYTYDGNDFNCDGFATIGMVNLQRLFQKTGMKFLHDENETCDPQGRYNFFKFTLGDKTQIKEIGNSCYEVVIEGNIEECEILEATEKLMVEIYSKYSEL
jgi:hypothetical protein